jgi:urocanate hydratase
MLMIQNNLDPKVAKHPHELITYGGNGAVFQNWAQYLLTMRYLSEMTENLTLVLYSGHPMGLFPSHPDAPRVVVTKGMMIPNYSKKDDWNKYNALGVTQYGQMTAGSFMYIGPQGIVHGTTITLLNAGRRIGLGDDLGGRVFITSGLGGMSGAQAIAAVITGCIGIIAEVDGKELRIDSRPSDAIAIAVRAHVPIFAHTSVMDEAGMSPDQDMPETSSASPKEAPAPLSDDANERLSIFKDFIDKLDIDSADQDKDKPDSPSP